ncbi:hypothetical protein WJX77_001017 [Trebouxia sp. C0004]
MLAISLLSRRQQCHRSRRTAQLGSSRQLLQIRLAVMYANYWSLLSPLPLAADKRHVDDMKYYLAPVSHSGDVAFSSTIHAVLLKNFPAGSEMVQAGCC